jgi:hypothetical protein
MVSKKLEALDLYIANEWPQWVALAVGCIKVDLARFGVGGDQ